MKVVISLLTQMIAKFLYERCRWLAWREWWHTFAFIKHDAILALRIYSLINTAAMEKLMPFPTKIHGNVVISEHITKKLRQNI